MVAGSPCGAALAACAELVTRHHSRRACHPRARDWRRLVRLRHVLRKPRLQSGCREIEKRTQLQRQQSPTGVDETDGSGLRLVLLERERQRSRSMSRPVIRSPASRSHCTDTMRSPIFTAAQATRGTDKYAHVHDGDPLEDRRRQAVSEPQRGDSEQVVRGHRRQHQEGERSVELHLGQAGGLSVVWPPRNAHVSRPNSVSMPLRPRAMSQPRMPCRTLGSGSDPVTGRQRQDPGPKVRW